MSDHLHSLDEHGLPRWVGALLRRPVRLEGGARARVMARVRQSPPPRRPARPVMSWPVRRGVTSLAGILAAAACMTIVAFGALRAPGAAGEQHAAPGILALLHDSLHVSVSWPSHDTLRAASLRDSLRLVSIVVTAPGKVGLAIAGDFTGWRPLRMSNLADSAGTWAAQALLRPGTHRYTIMAGSKRVTHTVTVPGEK